MLVLQRVSATSAGSMEPAVWVVGARSPGRAQPPSINTPLDKITDATRQTGYAGQVLTSARITDATRPFIFPCPPA